jgi:hypothetical protein
MRIYDLRPKIAGGVKLKRTSLVSPPPCAVIIERRITPKRSVFLLIATIAPAIEKAITPSISITVENISITKPRFFLQDKVLQISL